MMTMKKLDLPEVLGALFHPRREPPGLSPPRGVFLTTAEVAPGVKIGGRLHPGSERAPVVVFFHGNGEVAVDYDAIAPLFTRLGLTLMIWDYRGYGRSGGSPTGSALLEDAALVFEATPTILDGYNLSPDQTLVMGRSLGSAAALEVAASAPDRVDGLIIESGFADTFALLGRLGLGLEGDEATEGFGNLAKIGRIEAPTLVIHGEDDRIIPISEGRALHRASAARRKRLVTIGDAGHNDLMLVGLTRYFEAIRGLIDAEAVES